MITPAVASVFYFFLGGVAAKPKTTQNELLNPLEPKAKNEPEPRKKPNSNDKV